MSSTNCILLTGRICLGLLLLSFASQQLGAEPYIAFREGYKCSACHVNHTGGGKRNDFGALFTQTEMTPLMEKASENAMDFAAQIGEGLTLGADFMVVEEALFSVDEKLQTGDRDERYEQDSQNSFDIRSGNLYLEATLIPQTLTLYLDETVAPGGASNREAFILMESLPYSGYLKAGHMLLPYGIRVWDDATFIRQVTGFNYDNQDLGFEVGFEPGNAALVVAISNGTQGTRDDNSGKQISTVGSIYLSNAVLGGSFAYNKTRGIERLLFGPFASLRLGPVTAMGEADFLSDDFGKSKQDQFIFFGSLNYWARESLNFRLAFDFLDPFDGVEEDEKSRVTLGIEAFLTPYLQASAHYKLKNSIPQDIPGNTDALTLGLHAFF